jgi:excinuclease ABC subunit A
MRPEDCIRIRGARQHNLQNIDIDIPRNRLVVVTGVSGSGKSTLAFDTIYAEGTRRYVESLSAYARQFISQLQKPEVESIEGLTPTVAIEQRRGPANPRSTVATMTEIYDYLRVLYARAGDPHCPKCDRPIAPENAERMVDAIMAFPEGTQFMVLAPLIKGRKGEHRDVLDSIRRQGFVRVRVDGEVYDVREVPKLAKYKAHTIDAVVDRLTAKAGMRSRLTDSVEAALRAGGGTMIVSATGKDDRLFSELFACPEHGAVVDEIAPRLFSFNSPYGACPACDGLGNRLEMDTDLIVPDTSLTLADGAIEAWRRGGPAAIYYARLLRGATSALRIDMNTPFKDLPSKARHMMLYGTSAKDEAELGERFDGVIRILDERFRRTESEFVKTRLLAYMSAQPCPECKGARLKPAARAVRVADLSLPDLTARTVRSALQWVTGLKLTGEKAAVAAGVCKEVRDRLSFLDDVGLAYLTLDRTAGTLSGGEAQRIRLAGSVGSKLVGVTYVLDEPTIGLHQRDNDRLLATLKKLRDLGNTVLVVEHDEDVMRHADWLIDLGPGAGKLGGRIVAAGRPEEVAKDQNSLTGAYLSGRESIGVPEKRRPAKKDKRITITDARTNNLKGITVNVPLGVFVCVTGVSGSGKSSLISDTLYPALHRKLFRSKMKPGPFGELKGAGDIEKTVDIDQSAIGRTPRSNPATYTGLFDEIRSIFSHTAEARIRGYSPGRFSFNVKGGRCENCEGQGSLAIEMHFLPDVYVTCEQCKGRRYNLETLEVRFKGLNIAEVLDLTVSDARDFFKAIPKVKEILDTLVDVGLGYMHLGQSSTTLSGGEAQRVKLSAELARKESGDTLYVLDEPTTGLHFHDIRKLLNVLSRLVDKGNTVIVIEHNLDVVKTADWIIDLGPEGGEGGGRIVAEGTPEQVAECAKSFTGQYLKRVLK